MLASVAVLAAEQLLVLVDRVARGRMTTSTGPVCPSAALARSYRRVKNMHTHVTSASSLSACVR